MQTLLYITAFVLTQTGWGQGFFSTPAITLQYAGSTGWLSTGISAVTPDKKLETGILYGYVPASKGGTLHSVSGKFTYNPFHLQLNSNWSLEPLQAGAFFVFNFGPGLGTLWEPYYPKGYYWWPRNFRQHIFLGAQITYHFNNNKFVDRLSVYIETNTNDLYLYSYFANLHAFKPTDIFFLGTGIKTYLK
jgi:hypothetical protein